MKRGFTLALFAALALGITVFFATTAIARDNGDEDIPLKQAKLIIEHNATDEDTGFQGFIDSDGWKHMDIRGPSGRVLSFSAQRGLGDLGMTELFFETVEPTNAEIPIEEVLSALPEGEYLFSGKAFEAGEDLGKTSGVAVLTHAIPAGPELLMPAEEAVVPTENLTMSWSPVTETITGEDVTIIAYQLIMEEDVEPTGNMIGKFGLSLYVGPSVTSITLPNEFLEPGTTYSWEVLAIEESGNQTLSSGSFQTE